MDGRSGRAERYSPNFAQSWADPNLIFGNDTLLMMAISESHLECAEILLQHGADINLTVGPVSAFSEAMLHLQYADVIWVLNHRYMHDLPTARRSIVRENRNPRPGQEAMRDEALRIIDQRIAEQKNSNSSPLVSKAGIPNTPLNTDSSAAGQLKR
jgi:ankyrin repeat protein